MTSEEAKALSRIVTAQTHRSAGLNEEVLGSLNRRGLIEIDEHLFLHPNRDAALRALASFVLEGPRP